MLDEKSRDVTGSAAGQHDVGQCLVHGGGPFHGGDLFLDGAVRLPQPAQGDPALLVEPGVVEGDGGVVGEGAEERHLVLLEGALGAVGGEEDADDPLAHQERHAEQRDEPLVGHQGVEHGAVAEDLGLAVVAHPERGP